jgi:drug/metabolite transporter (DMT)-like permease
MTMAMYAASIVLIVISNTLYNIAQKSTPEKVNPFAAMLLTYLTAAVLMSLALAFSKPEGGIPHAFKGLNWTSLLLGVSIIGLEMGYLLAYRAGWQITVASLVANITLALALIPVGIFLYNESFEPRKLLGAALCIGGLIVINLK